MKLLKLMLSVVLLTSLSFAADAKSAVFDKVKSLEGEWEGTATEGGKVTNKVTTFKVVSGGSAVLSELDPGTPGEMITMFHMDGTDIIATHYCAAHNQPRMRAPASADPNNILFQFKDATNVGPNEGRMDSVRLIIVDANHHIQEWTFRDGDNVHTGRFEFHRKGKSAPASGS